jgi:hypothetical protein
MKLNKIYKTRQLFLRAAMIIYVTVVDFTGTNLAAVMFLLFKYDLRILEVSFERIIKCR